MQSRIAQFADRIHYPLLTDMSPITTTSNCVLSFCAVASVCIVIEKWKQHLKRKRKQVISRRGESLLTPTLPYIIDYLKCLQDHCDPYTNPQGHIPLCMSENKLIIELVGLRLMQIETASRAFSDSNVYCYNNTLGLPGPREAVAYFLGELLLYGWDGIRITISHLPQSVHMILDM